jgi:acyl-CoA reductase-like NAD-dependent aldehyde dehydrogenase
MMGEVLEVAKDMETRSYREPLGVVASICPFSKSVRLLVPTMLICV